MVSPVAVPETISANCDSSLVTVSAYMTSTKDFIERRPSADCWVLSGIRSNQTCQTKNLSRVRKPEIEDLIPESVGTSSGLTQDVPTELHQILHASARIARDRQQERRWVAGNRMAALIWAVSSKIVLFWGWAHNPGRGPNVRPISGETQVLSSICLQPIYCIAIARSLCMVMPVAECTFVHVRF